MNICNATFLESIERGIGAHSLNFFPVIKSKYRSTFHNNRIQGHFAHDTFVRSGKVGNESCMYIRQGNMEAAELLVWTLQFTPLSLRSVTKYLTVF